jgi:hypothetical protein
VARQATRETGVAAPGESAYYPPAARRQDRAFDRTWSGEKGHPR